MKNYLATFSSHYGALTFYQRLQSEEVWAEIIPLPRALSSSCGICVRYQSNTPLGMNAYELECIYLQENSSFVLVESF